MIVVDTSVWIDLLRGTPTPQAARCRELIEIGADVGLTDIVLTELLQGVPDEQQAAALEARLLAFPCLALRAPDDHILAARLYRDARRGGVTIRRTLDCLIAAACITTDATLLHSDADFDRLASCSALRVLL